MKLLTEQGEAITAIHRVLVTKLGMKPEEAHKRAKVAVLGDPRDKPKPEPKAPEKPWHCCGVPVLTVGLDVQCQGACGRKSR